MKIHTVIVTSAITLKTSATTPEEGYPPCTMYCINETINDLRINLSANDAYYNNGVLCDNRTYLTSVAERIYDKCGLDELKQAAQINSAGCNSTGTPSALSQNQFVDASGATGAGITTLGDVIPACNMQGNNNTCTIIDISGNDDNKSHQAPGGLSDGAIVGIVVGSVTIVMGIPVFILGLRKLLRRRRTAAALRDKKQNRSGNANQDRTANGPDDSETSSSIELEEMSGGVTLPTPAHVR